MRILTIGVLSFIAWSSLSTYLYVCKIKGLCNDPVALHMSVVSTENLIAADTAKQSIVEEQLTVPTDIIIHFAFDKSEFSSNSISERYFDESNAYMSQNKIAQLQITGHTDATGTIDYNQSLGYRRAQRMQDYFKSKGILEDKIIILSKGESEPADDNMTKDGRANNRRTVITIKK